MSVLDMVFTAVYKADNSLLLLLSWKATGQSCPQLGRKKVILKKLQSRSKKWKNDKRLLHTWGHVFLLCGFKKIFSWSFLHPSCHVIRQHLQENIKQHLPVRKTCNMVLSSQSLVHSSPCMVHIYYETQKATLDIVKSCVSYVKWCRSI